MRGSGTGRVVAITGEAGIGKSRLIRDVRDSLRDEALAVEYFCSPYHTTTALFPVTDRIARANFRAEDGAEQKLVALRKMLSAAGPDYEPHLPWLAALMSLPDKGVGASRDAAAAQAEDLRGAVLVDIRACAAGIRCS